MRCHRFGAACLIMLAAGAASSQPIITGNDLLERARTDEPKALAYLTGYVHGWQSREVVAELQLSSVSGAKKLLSRNSVCMPATATIGQGLDVVVKYLETNPQSRHEYATSLIWMAFAKAWPCPP